MFRHLKDRLQAEYKSRQQYVCYSAIRLDQVWSDIKFEYWKGYY